MKLNKSWRTKRNAYFFQMTCLVSQVSKQRDCQIKRTLDVNFFHTVLFVAICVIFIYCFSQSAFSFTFSLLKLHLFSNIATCFFQVSLVLHVCVMTSKQKVK